MYWHKSPKLFSSTRTVTRYILDADTKVFVVPRVAGAEDEDYVVRDSTYFSTRTHGDPNSGENIFVYNVTDATPEAMVVQATISDTNPPRGINLNGDAAAVIKQKFNGVDENGETYIGLRVLHENKEKLLKINESEVHLLRMKTNNAYTATPYVDDTVENPVLLTVDDFNFGDVIMFSQISTSY